MASVASILGAFSTGAVGAAVVTGAFTVFVKKQKRVQERRAEVYVDILGWTGTRVQKLARQLTSLDTGKQRSAILSNDKKITFPDPEAVDPNIQNTNPGTLFFTTLRARVVAFGTHDMARAFDRWAHVYEMTLFDLGPECSNHPESADRNDSVLDCEVFTMVKTAASTNPRGRGERDAGNAGRHPKRVVEVLVPDSGSTEPVQVEVTGDHPKLNKGQPVRFEQLEKNENGYRKPEYCATSILAYGPPDCRRSALRAIVTGPPDMCANIHRRDHGRENLIMAALGILRGLFFWQKWRKKFDPGITDYGIRGDLTMAIERCASKELRKG
jgi:hypothetical protein